MTGLKVEKTNEVSNYDSILLNRDKKNKFTEIFAQMSVILTSGSKI